MVLKSSRSGSILGWATSFFFNRFQSEKKGLSRVKKVKAFSLCHGGVVVKAVMLKAYGARIDS